MFYIVYFVLYLGSPFGYVFEEDNGPKIYTSIEECQAQVQTDERDFATIVIKNKLPETYMLGFCVEKEYGKISDG